MNNLIIGFLICVVVLNIGVSVFISKRDDLESQQKLFQIILIWLIPLVAAIGLLFFNLSHDKDLKPMHKEFGGGTTCGNGGSHDVGGD